MAMSSRDRIKLSKGYSQIDSSTKRFSQPSITPHQKLKSARKNAQIKHIKETQTKRTSTRIFCHPKVSENNKSRVITKASTVDKPDLLKATADIVSQRQAELFKDATNRCRISNTNLGGK